MKRHRKNPSERAPKVATAGTNYEKFRFRSRLSDLEPTFQSPLDFKLRMPLTMLALARLIQRPILGSPFKADTQQFLAPVPDGHQFRLLSKFSEKPAEKIAIERSGKRSLIKAILRRLPLLGWWGGHRKLQPAASTTSETAAQNDLLQSAQLQQPREAVPDPTASEKPATAKKGRTGSDLDAAVTEWRSHRAEFEKAQAEEARLFERLERMFQTADKEAVEIATLVALKTARLPWSGFDGHGAQFDPASGTMYLDFQLPDFNRCPIHHETPRGNRLLPAGRQQDIRSFSVAGLSIRVMVDLSKLLNHAHVKNIAFNGFVRVSAEDKSSSHERIVVSLFDAVDELRALDPAKIDQRAYIISRGGAVSLNLLQHDPVVPMWARRDVSR